MLLLGIDFETTGIDSKEDRPIEMGIVVWDTEKRVPAYLHSCYILGENWPKPTEEAQAVSNIDPEWVRAFYTPPHMALDKLCYLAEQCDFMVAHNADFEMAFISEWLKRHPVIAGAKLKTIPWIDTKVHLPFPPKVNARDLVSLCSHHGFFNPHPHRALFDAWAMMKILDQYPLADVIENAQSAKCRLWSIGITFNTKDRPKSVGYHWHGETKRWFTDVKLSEEKDATEKALKAGFEVKAEHIPICTNIEDFESIRKGSSETAK